WAVTSWCRSVVAGTAMLGCGHFPHHSTSNFQVRVGIYRRSLCFASLLSGRIVAGRDSAGVKAGNRAITSRQKECHGGRRILAIYNPTAGRRARDKFERFRTALARLGATVTIAETERSMHARELAEAADPARFDAVAVAGGDGTINEAVNGVVHSGLPLAIL